MTSFRDAGPKVEVTFADAQVRLVDMLVCADGITSSSRARLLPAVSPHYAGYVAWRGVLPESRLSAAAFECLSNAITYQQLPAGHILVYPIPAAEGSVQVGERLMNMVWYRNADHGELSRVLTDRDGEARPVSVPPGMVSPDLVREMRAQASDLLAPPVAEVATGIEVPFVQAIFDIQVPQMAFGRTCLLGDAAFAVRPHAAAGTAKAAEDGWVLGEELLNSGGDVPATLESWQRRQLKLGAELLARTRWIGDTAQFAAGLTPGDPRLIFGLYEPGR